MANRLYQESSPYLLQHADNPVDWHPWGEEALAKATREDKPILLSVGYSSCHWCHVMAHESFEDQETAALMNSYFVNIKVDREERPDIDSIYMSAVQAMTGSGGWPMTVVMTPAGKPFFGGTYFPKEPRYGQPSFQRVLLSLAGAWQNQREEVLDNAERMTQHLKALVQPGTETGELSEALFSKVLENLERRFDARHGGFGGAPKFPPSSLLQFLLEHSEAQAWQMAHATLEKMARGGLYDQLGGGFSRYSVDEQWLVPHFEKMLYDNGQLVQRYAQAYQRDPQPLYVQVIEETVAWLEREMLDPSGGFYSALDADSEGEEGKFYVWSEEEIDRLLADDARLTKAYFGISIMGNFEGHNVLHVPHDAAAIAERFGLSLEALAERIAALKDQLFEARSARVRPGLDDKILCSWNGLMLAGLADAARVLGREDYLALASRNAAFVRDQMMQAGRLFHTFKAGEAKVAGLLEDYAYYGLGLVALYRASLDGQWLLLALELAEVMMAHFYDAAEGGFYSTADDAEALIVRPKDYFDAAVPSGNGAAALLLISLARYSGKRSWEDIAVATLKPMLEGMEEHPNGFGSLLYAAELAQSAPQEIAIFADREDEVAQGMLELIARKVSGSVAVALIENDDDPLMQSLSFLPGRSRVAGEATAYVCQAGVCQLPVTTLEAFAAQLETLRAQ